mmetsp:Transcript_13872/g.54800  ORF Transcript_13872/g.54800 Transcript_13872/m.54800 type:complete len:300 (-) Transcript_13872:60-959(-)
MGQHVREDDDLLAFLLGALVEVAADVRGLTPAEHFSHPGQRQGDEYEATEHEIARLCVDAVEARHEEDSGPALDVYLESLSLAQDPKRRIGVHGSAADEVAGVDALARPELNCPVLRHCLAVHCENDVVLLHYAVRRTQKAHLAHAHTARLRLWNTEVRSQARVLQVLADDAHVCHAREAPERHVLLDEQPHHPDRNDVASAGSLFQGAIRYTDNLVMCVEARPTAVAGVQCSVDLNGQQRVLAYCVGVHVDAGDNAARYANIVAAHRIAHTGDVLVQRRNHRAQPQRLHCRRPLPEGG